MLVSEKRDLAATRRFFLRALEHGLRPTEVTTDQAPAYPRVIEEVSPAACLKRLRSARVISAGHAFVQSLRRGHSELGSDIDRRYRLIVIFAELTRAI